MSDGMTVDDFKKKLSSEKKDLISQLVDMGVDPATGVPSGDQFEQGFADSGQSTAEKARVLSFAEGVIASMKEVDAALDRIEKGTFGVCESCGKQIQVERLEARPVARLCLDCKRRNG